LDRYPLEAPIVELSSPSLPAPLLRSKERECAEKAKEYLGHAQVKHIYNIIYNFIQSNLFIPCWREIKQIATLCEGTDPLTGHNMIYYTLHYYSILCLRTDLLNSHNVI
jgi:hypothetical protein